MSSVKLVKLNKKITKIKIVLKHLVKINYRSIIAY